MQMEAITANKIYTSTGLADFLYLLKTTFKYLKVKVYNYASSSMRLYLGSPKSLGIITWQPHMSIQNFVTIHPVDVDIFL